MEPEGIFLNRCLKIRKQPGGKLLNEIIAVTTMIRLSLTVVYSIPLGFRNQMKGFTFLISFNAKNTRGSIGRSKGLPSSASPNVGAQSQGLALQNLR